MFEQPSDLYVLLVVSAPLQKFAEKLVILECSQTTKSMFTIWLKIAVLSPEIFTTAEQCSRLFLFYYYTSVRHKDGGFQSNLSRVWLEAKTTTTSEL